MATSFSPITVSRLIIEPLRYFFKYRAAGYELVWDADEKIRTIEIDHANNFNNVAIQKNPRIIISRGDYNVNKTGLTDNMVSSDLPTSHGLDNRVNMVFITGQATITIEARNQGTCELIADMVSHFIVWSRPLLCDTQGFKEFGLPMTVSDCNVDQEDREKFRVSISIPFLMEERWTVNQDALGLKGFFINLAKA